MLKGMKGDGMTDSGSTPAGWYPDPEVADHLRYWDGAAWTDFRRSTLTPPPPNEAPAHMAPSAPGGQHISASPVPWWQTWYAVIAGLLLCLPVGLVALWMRRGTSTGVKVLVTGAGALLLVVAATAGPSSSGGGLPAADTTSITTPTSATQSPTPTPSVKPVSVPRLTGMSLAEAKQRLKAAHLKPGTPTKRPSRAARGTVLHQSPGPGSKSAPGTVVELTVAAPLPTVPNVVGKQASAAESALKRAGFKVRSQHQSNTSVQDGVVLSQAPGAGVQVQPGTTVVLVVAQNNCTPGYSPCLPIASDYDCAGGSGNGPKYVSGTVRVTGSDPYGLDANHDGIGCN
jgi:resuscitation-promoting factor RpfB